MSEIENQTVIVIVQAYFNISVVFLKFSFGIQFWTLG
jgi:hypothetical protein